LAENDNKVARGVLYAFTRIILFVVAILVIALGFYTGMDSMNVNVITKDAFTMRAESVLEPSSVSEEDLPKLFTQDFINTDSVLNSTKYEDYTITNYYQRADVKAKIVWPWMNKVVVHATEEVMDITGTLKESAEVTAADTAEDAQTDEEGQIQVNVKDKTPPDWVSGEYEVTLVKDEKTSAWQVEEMKLIEVIEPTVNTPSEGTQETASAEASGGE
jgi:hypothetical protein